MNSAADRARKPASFIAMLEAGVKAVCESGVDRISVSQVAKITGHTRPTFYSYFGDTQGLLAEIWLAWSEEWLARLADFSYEVAKDSEENRCLHQALTEILAIAHRSAEILEVVQPQLELWWQSYASHTDLEKLKVLWLVGERLGATITAAVDPAAASAAFVEPALQMVPSKPNQPLAAIDLDALPNVSSPMLDDGSTETQLIQAAADVISSSGVASASMARIARKAQVSTGTIYPRFENITDLVDAAFELSISAVIEQNFALLANTNFEPDDFGLFVMAGLGPKRSVWRNFRVEIHLEARLRDALKVRMTQNLHESNARVAEKIRQYDLRDLVVGPIPYLIHNIGVGFAILQNAGIELLKIDHRLLTRELVAAVLRLAK